MKQTDVITLTEKYCASNYAPLPLVIQRAEGAWVWDLEGKKYLDMLACYSALNQGHRHPKVIEALLGQLERVTLTSRAFHNDQLGPLAQELCTLSGFDRFLPMNTGAEAVETALKLVRKWGYQVKGVPNGKAEIITCEGNFHGRTTTIVGFSTEAQYRNDFGPYSEGFKTIPYGDPGALERAITSNTVAFLVEPIQGEGGIRIPLPGYLKAVREICAAKGILLVLDEIQTGFGRTGKLFAYQHENARPDVLVVGKALGGGILPISGILCDQRIMQVFTPGDHGSTFGGNPLACAVARQAVRVIVEEKLSERSAELGQYLMDALGQMKSPHVREIRGKGLFIGVEIREEVAPARPFCVALMHEGVLAKETHHQVIRFAPPLVITKEDIDWALPRIRKILAGPVPAQTK